MKPCSSAPSAARNVTGCASGGGASRCRDGPACVQLKSNAATRTTAFMVSLGSEEQHQRQGRIGEQCSDGPHFVDAVGGPGAAERAGERAEEESPGGKDQRAGQQRRPVTAGAQTMPDRGQSDQLYGAGRSTGMDHAPL